MKQDPLDEILDKVSLNSARGYTKIGLKAAINSYILGMLDNVIEQFITGNPPFASKDGKIQAQAICDHLRKELRDKLK